MSHEIDFKIGDTVRFQYNTYEGTGTVLFIGPLPSKEQPLWLGIERATVDDQETTKPDGDNGCLGDTTYFKCTSNKGIFVPCDCDFVSLLSTENTDNISEINSEQKSDTATADTSGPRVATALANTTIIDPKELALKLKQNFKNRTDQTLHQMREFRNVLSAMTKTTQTDGVVSNKTAQLLQEQKLLSQTVRLQQRQTDIEKIKRQHQQQDMDVQFNEQQLQHIDVMSKLLVQQCQPPLNSLVVDIEELQARQDQFLHQFSRSSIWFNKEQRQRLNEMSKVMNEVPAYRRKLQSMQQKMNDISYKVTKLKRNTQQLKKRIDFHY
mmetsp:Transcript_11989/g.18095  ORF Transcript_11989/g.18095 Transcript_11989/m.18095 type:complete len:324 (+) Transcript_11989:27-998(+)